jgi:hypothetical protein
MYAFGLIFAIISTGPTLRAASLLYSPTENLSFVKIAHKKSPSSNSTARLFLSALALYLAVDSCNFWIVNLWPSWIWIIRSSAVVFVLVMSGIGAKSSGARGLLP